MQNVNVRCMYLQPLEYESNIFFILCFQIIIFYTLET